MHRQRDEFSMGRDPPPASLAPTGLIPRVNGPVGVAPIGRAGKVLEMGSTGEDSKAQTLVMPVARGFAMDFGAGRTEVLVASAPSRG